MSVAAIIVVIDDTVIYFNQLKALSIINQQDTNWSISDEILSIIDDNFCSHSSQNDKKSQCFTIIISNQYKLSCKKKEGLLIGFILDSKEKSKTINKGEYEICDVLNNMMPLILNKFKDDMNEMMPAFLLQIYCHSIFQQEYKKFINKQQCQFCFGEKFEENGPSKENEIETTKTSTSALDYIRMQDFDEVNTSDDNLHYGYNPHTSITSLRFKRRNKPKPKITHTRNFSETISFRCIEQGKDKEEENSSTQQFDKRSSTTICKYDHLLKIVIVGNNNVGRSSLLQRFCEPDYQFNPDLHEKTVNGDFRLRVIEIDGECVKFQLWDVPVLNSTRKSSMRSKFYENCHGVIIVYDITNRESFKDIDCWVKEIKHYTTDNTLIFIFGNKLDKTKDENGKSNGLRNVELIELQQKAYNLHTSCYELSAMDTKSVNEAFIDIGEQLITFTRHPTMHHLSIFDKLNETELTEIQQGTNMRLITMTHDTDCTKSRPSRITKNHSIATIRANNTLKYAVMDHYLSDDCGCLRFFVYNIWIDLDDMFYILSRLILLTMIDKDNKFCLSVLKTFARLFIYPLIIFLSLIIILPTCMFLLMVMIFEVNKEDRRSIDRLSKVQRLNQGFFQSLQRYFRMLFMFIFLNGIPCLIGMFASNQYVEILIIIYLIVLLMILIFSTYRSLQVCIEKRNNKLKDKSFLFKPSKFHWTFGSLLTVLFIIYEMLQFSLFVFHSKDFNHDIIAQLDYEIYLDIITNFDALRGVYFDLIIIGIILLLWSFEFMDELKTYAKLRWIDQEKQKAKESYYHSFIGTVINGHNSLKYPNMIACKIMFILCDVFFLIMIEKLVLNLSYHINWNKEQRIYATISCLIISYYVPFSVLISPLYSEQSNKFQDGNNNNNKSMNKKSINKSFWSFENKIYHLKPYLSAILITKFAMIIFSHILFTKYIMATIIAQSIAMIGLFIFTIIWTLQSLNLFGLSWNEPIFPFYISLIRCIGFSFGLICALLQFIIFYNVIPFLNNDKYMIITILFIAIMIICIVFLIFILKYNKFYSTKNINNIDCDLIVWYKNREMRVIHFYSLQ